MNREWKLIGAIVLLTAVLLASPFSAVLHGTMSEDVYTVYANRGSRAPLPIGNLTNGSVAALDGGSTYYADTVLNFTVKWQDGLNQSLSDLGYNLDLWVNYTSDSTVDNRSFSVDVANNVTGPNASAGLTYWIHLSLPVGVYNLIWFNASASPYTRNTSNAFVSAVTIVNSPPTLSSPGFTPASGTTATTFTFNITYTDIDNDAFSAGMVWVSGSNGTHTANLTVSGGDGDYTNGENLVATVDGSAIGVGDFMYMFNVTDTNTSANIETPWYEGGWINLTVANIVVTGDASIAGNQSNETYNITADFYYHTASVLPMGNTLTLTLNSVAVNMTEVDNTDTDATDGKAYFVDNITLVEGKNTLVFNVSVNTSLSLPHYDNYTKTTYFWVNRAPTLQYPTGTQAQPGQSVTITPTAIGDPDGDDMNISLVDKDFSETVTIEAGTGVISFTAPSTPGTYHMNISYMDDNGSAEMIVEVSFDVISLDRPYVVYTIPANGTQEVPITTNLIQVQFDHAIDPSTLTKDVVGTTYPTIAVGYGMNALNIDIDYNETTYLLNITINDPLPQGKDISLNLQCNELDLSAYGYGKFVPIKDIYGNNLQPNQVIDLSGGQGLLILEMWVMSFRTYNFTVADTTPADGAQDVEVDTPITVHFNHTIDQSTITDTTFLVQDSHGNSVSGSISFPQADTAVFTPDSPLAYGEAYTVTLKGDIKDSTGVNLNGDLSGYQSDYVFSFSTKAEFLNVSSTTPADGAEQVDREANIQIVFSKALNESSLDGHIHLAYKSNGTEVAFTTSVSGTTLTIDPVAPLDWGTTYRVTIDTEVSAADGSPFDSDGILSNGISTSPYVFEFTTETYPLNATSNLDGATDVPVDTTILIVFNNDINLTAAPVDNTTITLMAGMHSVDINVSYNEATHTATITPAQPLDYETTYTVTVSSSITDVNGKALDNNADGTPDNYIFSFTTEEYPLNITATTPEDGAKNVSISTEISFVFNKKINVSTLADKIAITGFGTLSADNYTYDNSSKKVTINLGRDLDYETTYTVTISKGVATATGNELREDFSFSFTTVKAPVTTGGVSGVVKDSEGNPLVGATVRLLDSSGNEVATTVTNDTGGYTFENIPEGSYTVEISKTGYQTQTVDVTVSAGETAEAPSATVSPEGGGNNNNNNEEETSEEEDKGLLGLGKLGGIDLAYILIAVIVLIVIIAVVVVVKKKKGEEEMPAMTEMPPIEGGEGMAPAEGAAAEGAYGEYPPQEGYPEQQYGAEYGAPEQEGIAMGAEGEGVLPEEELFAAPEGEIPAEQPGGMYAEQPEEISFAAETAVPEEEFSPPGGELGGEDEDLFDIDFDEGAAPAPEAAPQSSDEDDLFDIDFEDEAPPAEKKSGDDDMDDLFGDL